MTAKIPRSRQQPCLHSPSRAHPNPDLDTPMTPPTLPAWGQRLAPTLAKTAAGLGLLVLLAWQGLPRALHPQVERLASEALGRKVTVEGIAFTPWTLELEVRGLRIARASGDGSDASSQASTGADTGSDAASQLSIGRLYANAELASLWRLAPVVDAVRVEHPVLSLARREDGQLDVQDILDHLAANARPTQPPEPGAPPPRLAIHNIELTDGELTLDDATARQQHQVRALHLSIPFIHTLGQGEAVREVRVEPKLAFTLNGSPFETQASTQPFSDSLRTEATLAIRDVNLTPYLAYLPADLPVRPTQATLGAELNISFAQTPQPGVRLTGHLSASDLTLTDARQHPLLQLASARIELADVRPLERVALLGDITLDAPHLSLARDAQGQFNFSSQTGQKSIQNIKNNKADKPIAPSADGKKTPENIHSQSNPPSGTESGPAVANPADSAWTLGVARFKLNQGRVDWRDALVGNASRQPTRLALTDLDLQATQLHLPLPTDTSQATALDISARIGQGGHGGPPASGSTSQTTRESARADKPAAASRTARLSMQGSLLASEAQATLELQDLGLELLAPYLQAHLKPSLSGQLGLQTKLTWKPAATAGQPDDITLALPQLRLGQLRLLDGKTELASLQALDIRDASLNLREHSASLGRITLTRPNLPVQRAADGQLMFSQWLVADGTGDASHTGTAQAQPGHTAKSSQPATPAWRWNLPELSIIDGQVGWRDAVPAETVTLQASAFRLSLQGLNSGGIQPASLTTSLRLGAGSTEPGSLSWRGTVALGADGQSPQVRGQLDARRLPAHALAPYAAGQLNLALLRADASYLGSVALQTSAAGPSVQLAGDVTLEDFRANTTPAAPARPEELLNWKTLNLKGLDVKLAPATAPQITVASGALSDFFARVIIQETGRINLQDISKQAAADAAKTAPPANATAAADPALAPRISIGPFSLVNGTVDFADRFIRPNYRANLSDLTGRLGGFSSEGAKATNGETAAPQMAELELRGRAEGTASLQITGKLNPLATPLALDIEGRVRDLELPPLSPYTIKYTGHGIERGKLSLDVAYTVQPNGQLTARNQLVLNQLTFGQAVAGAPASLPVRLATALLADRHGVIDLNLPISGSLNDPEFKLAPIIFKIIGNIIVKAITSPFSLLTGMLGGADTDLSQVAFVPGTARFDPASTARLERVAKALTDKPGLTLTVVGTASLEAERNAYQRDRLNAQLLAERQRSQPAPATPGAAPSTPATAASPDTAGSAAAELTGPERVRWLTALYKRTDMPKPRNALGLAKDLAPEDMEALLLAQIPANADTMQALATQRGVAVRDLLAQQQHIPLSRLFLGAPGTPPAKSDAPWQPSAELKLGMP